MTYFANEHMLEQLGSGLVPPAVRAHEAVASHYGIGFGDATADECIRCVHLLCAFIWPKIQEEDLATTASCYIDPVPGV